MGSIFYMRIIKIILLLLLIVGCKNSKDNMLQPRVVTNSYHGHKIKDPYSYAENLEDLEIKSWIERENESSKSILKRIEKLNFLIDKQIEYDANKKFKISRRRITENGKHFYLKRMSNENVSKLYYKASFSDDEILLYDPKNFKNTSNTEFLINYIAPNWDGSKIVVSLTEKGKEISELIILDVNTGKQYQRSITNTWPSVGGIKWLPNNFQFIYLHHPVVDQNKEGFLKNTKSVLFDITNPSFEIKTIFSKENNKDLDINEEDFPIVTLENSKSKYLIGKVSGGLDYYDSYYQLISDVGEKSWVPLFKKTDQIKIFFVKGDSLIYRTSKDAPNFKICKTSISNPDFENPVVLVNEFEDKVITDFAITNDGLYFVTNKNGVKASLYKQEGNGFGEIELPETYGDIGIRSKGYDDPELWITAKGWTTDNKSYEYKQGVLKDNSVNVPFENQKIKNIIVEEIEVTAHDGKKIPLSLIYNKGLKKDGKNIVMMDGYGAFGISMEPSFSLRRLLWVMEGGIYAIAHIRGGGEKGDAWHKGGYKITKPNTWKDFISCAEFLIENKFTSPEKMAIWSGSAGGILIGRSITERPDLFKAAIVEFGALNVIRSMEDANGANIAKELGDINDPEEFQGLLEMDSYHHINDKGEKYPSTLLTAGLNDPRVPVWNSIKFGARLKAANTSKNTHNLLLIDAEAGHGIDDTKRKEFERFATILSFALWQTGHPDYQIKS
ncbi:oligopeptidase B Serine peptidase. MEROPS family S09A [Aquimarina spongiae]|uniref:prolyl oligopeptidase n=2 Tax=Aquimarina spongiae TaxID=570521 RepID=A0A1M6IF13_9FLAO|nr:oligopeptidase B Serine peptidase. MEROPS family S09A [Aquimarina spongiae]